ncbi:response regulator transcription factor [Streptomyces sp. A012304]|uniref:response regulator transcription factor n=1 Tax=Streptomyces sp. A012304 TaxID=375446 RepID=UPI00222E8A67|nr:response regulator transcription factor [Streptomyces sp. A012304]GKQ35969.1 DNA-binding response regulator [Streptomyces sp. A012304]
MRVLLVEDDRDVAEPLRRGLARHGHDVTWVATGRAALGAPASDMVLLDLGLPDMDGLDVCRELRAHSDVPIIMISGRDSEVEKVVGLELGADDYLVKPFLIRELIARMRAVRRRHRPRHSEVPGPAPDRGTLATYGRMTIDRRAHRVFLDGAEVPLRPREYALVDFLTGRLGDLVPRETIMTTVWDSNWFGSTKTLDVHVTALRHKLGDALTIECVRGVGFRMLIGPGLRAVFGTERRVLPQREGRRRGRGRCPAGGRSG